LLSLSGFPLPFRFLSSASLPVPATQPLLLPFLLFPASPHSGFPGAPFRFRFQAFPFLSGLISHAFLPGSRTRLYCSFPFALPCFAPTAACQVLALSSRFRHFLLPVRFLSSASLPLPATQPSVSSFPLFPVSPLSGFSGAPFRFRFQAFPFLSGLISRAFLPGSRTRLSVCFLSPFPDSLPQLFLRCFPSALAFGLSPSNPLSFVRFSSGSGYSAFRLSFPFFPLSPVGGSRGASFLFRPACFHAFLPIPVLGSLQFLSPLAGSLHSS